MTAPSLPHLLQTSMTTRSVEKCSLLGNMHVHVVLAKPFLLLTARLYLHCRHARILARIFGAMLDSRGWWREGGARESQFYVTTGTENYDITVLFPVFYAQMEMFVIFICFRKNGWGKQLGSIACFLKVNNYW